MLKYNLEHNSDNRATIQVSKGGEMVKTPGLFRKFLGVVDGNILLSYKANGATFKTIYGIPINNSLLNMQMNMKLPAFEVGKAEEE